MALTFLTTRSGAAFWPLRTTLALVVLATVVGAGCSGDSSLSPASERGFSEAQVTAFQALEGRTQPLPPRLADPLRGFRDARIRTLRFDIAKLVGGPGRGAWVVNGKGRTCIVPASRGGIACTPAKAFLQRGMIFGAADGSRSPADRPQRFLVWGVAPDSAAKVRLSIGRRIRQVVVRDNFYSLTAGSPILFRGLIPR